MENVLFDWTFTLDRLVVPERSFMTGRKRNGICYEMGVLPPPSAHANVNSIFLALIDLAPLAFKNRGVEKAEKSEQWRFVKWPEKCKLNPPLKEVPAKRSRSCLSTRLPYKCPATEGWMGERNERRKEERKKEGRKKGRKGLREGGEGKGREGGREERKPNSDLPRCKSRPNRGQLGCCRLDPFPRLIFRCPVVDKRKRFVKNVVTFLSPAGSATLTQMLDYRIRKMRSALGPIFIYINEDVASKTKFWK